MKTVFQNLYGLTRASVNKLVTTHWYFVTIILQFLCWFPYFFPFFLPFLASVAVLIKLLKCVGLQQYIHAYMSDLVFILFLCDLIYNCIFSYEKKRKFVHIKDGVFIRKIMSGYSLKSYIAVNGVSITSIVIKFEFERKQIMHGISPSLGQRLPLSDKIFLSW